MRRNIILLILTISFASLANLSIAHSFLANNEKTNFTEGIGNIEYPAISNHTVGGHFVGSQSIAVGDVTGDGHKEIISISVKEGVLYVYDENLKLLWMFSDTYYQKWNKYVSYGGIEEGTSSLALVDINGDGIKDILFSLSPSVCSVSTKVGEYSPKTTLYAMKGNGEILWNKTFGGGITPGSLVVSDINEDGKNEIIVGSDNLYLLSTNGTEISIFSLEKYPFRGIYEIVTQRSEVIFSFWYYTEVQKNVCVFSRPTYDVHFVLEKLSFYNDSFYIAWNKQLEEPNGIAGPNYYLMFSNSDFSALYITRAQPSGLVKINSSDGKTEWMEDIDSIVAPGIVVSVISETVVWNAIDKIVLIDSNGTTFRLFDISSGTTERVWATIGVFDVDNDGENDIILLDKTGIMAFSLDGDKKWDSQLWKDSSGYYDPSPVLHADIDGDTFDEIVFINPIGDIFIVDSGIPYKSQESGISVELMVICGISAIITASAVIWIWRKRKPGRC